MTEEVQEPEVIETAPVETPPEPQKLAWDAETEAEAKLLGWKSPDEWDGDKPPGYIDNPDDYLTRLEKSKPFRIMKERVDKATADAEAKLKRIEAGLEAGRKREAERLQADYDRKLADITAGQRQAVQEADPERFDALEKQRQSLKAPEPDAQAIPQGDPLEPFYADHEWLQDPLLVQEGAMVIEVGLRTGKVTGPDVAGQVAYAEAAMKRKYPHLFTSAQAKQEQPAAPPVQRVDAGGLGAAKRSGFDSLPSDAQAAFKRQVASGIFNDTKDDRKFYYDEYSKFGA